METITTKELKGPLLTAIKSLQLVIDKNTSRKEVLTQRAGKLLKEAQDLEVENEGLLEQIKKLKG